jgi:hypothetical protein
MSSAEIDTYLAGVEEPKRSTLQRLRQSIVEVADSMFRDGCTGHEFGEWRSFTDPRWSGAPTGSSRGAGPLYPNISIRHISIGTFPSHVWAHGSVRTGSPVRRGPRLSLPTGWALSVERCSAAVSQCPKRESPAVRGASGHIVRNHSRGLRSARGLRSRKAAASGRGSDKVSHPSGDRRHPGLRERRRVPFLAWASS